MKLVTKWTVLIAPIAVVAVLIVSILSIPTLSVEAAGFHGMKDGGRFNGHGFHERGMMVNHSFMLVPFLLTALAKVGMMIAGWVLMVRGKSSGVKISGGVLLAIGLLALLPSIIAIPLLILLGYLVYKGIGKKEGNVQELMSVNDLAVPVYTNRDFLDEWESNVRREEE